MKPRFRPGTHPPPPSLDLGSGEVLKSPARNFTEELTLDHLVLRYCRQIIVQAMDYVRSRMREDDLPALKRQVENVRIEKSELNPTKAIAQLVESVLGYIAWARRGLSGNAILEILWAAPDYKKHLDEESRQSARLYR